MQKFTRFAGTLATAVLLSASTSAFAKDVKVEGVHLCCGKCVKGASAALQDVNGVSNVRIDRDEETVSFEAADDAAAQRGLTSLAEAGFYGQPSENGPDFKVDPSINENEVHITRMHLCCGGCVKSASQALREVNGVKSLETNAKAGTITLKGEKINLAAALKALHSAGFHGKIE